MSERALAQPAEAFAIDPSLDGSVRCLVHQLDWDECGCWCEDDAVCASCGEWSSGLLDTAAACRFCGSLFPAKSP